MTNVLQAGIEDRLREADWYMSKQGPPTMQWVYGTRWTNHKNPHEGFSESDALYIEWQAALARAGRAEYSADYHRQRANAGLTTIIILGFVVTSLAVLFLLS